jgi:hypothetical protein
MLIGKPRPLVEFILLPCEIQRVLCMLMGGEGKLLHCFSFSWSLEFIKASSIDP